MARKQKPTGWRKWRLHYSRAWQNRHIKVLHVVVFALVFGWIGYHFFFANAATPYPETADGIVAMYQNLSGSKVQKLPDGSQRTVLGAGNVLVAGDGTLYCDAADGTLLQGKLAPGVLKQVFDSVNTADVKALAHSQHFNGVADYSKLAVIVVNATEGASVIYNQNDSGGVFARTAAKLQQQCQVNRPAAPAKNMPQFKDLNAPSDNRVVSLLSRWFGPATAGATGYLSGNGMFKDVNAHRTSSEDYTYEKNHWYLTLSRKSCLDSIAKSWAYHMARYGLQHNPNLQTQINNKCSSNWMTYGENVGEGPSLSSVYNAFMASCPHHSNNDDRRVTVNGTTCGTDETHAYYRFRYVGVGAYEDSQGTNWYVIDFANW